MTGEIHLANFQDDDIIESLIANINSGEVVVEQPNAWGWKNPETPVYALRCFRFYPPEGETVTQITQFPTRGKTRVNPDNTITVQLTEYAVDNGVEEGQRLVYDTDLQTGVTEDYAIINPRLRDGWHNGDTYIHRLDANGNQIVEADENVRIIHLANTGLSFSDIDTREGLAPGTVDAAWVLANTANPEGAYYGATEALALNEPDGRIAWRVLTGSGETSAILRLKGGDSFPSTTSRFLAPNASGYNDRFPLLIESHGTGYASAAVQSTNGNEDDPNLRVVIRNLETTNTTLPGFFRGSLERVRIGAGESIGIEQGNPTENGVRAFPGDGLSVYRCLGFDGFKMSPGGTNWTASGDRVTPIFLSRNVDMLVAQCVSDLAGWAPGYNPYSNSSAAGWYDPDGTYYATDPANGTAEFFDGTKQPPSQYSQGRYSKINRGASSRENFYCRGSLSCAQHRSGDVALGNVVVSFNSACNFFGDGYNQEFDIYTGNYTFVGRNVLTDVAYKSSAPQNGLSSFAQGIEVGVGPVAVDGLIAMHARNPDDLANEVFKEVIRYPIDEGRGVTLPYDNTIIYNYQGSVSGPGNRNVDGLNTAMLDATTIQRYADTLKGDPVGTNTIQSLMEYARDVMPDPWMLGYNVARFFQDACGVDPIPVTPATVTFLPREFADGMRWDVYMNWDLRREPGRYVKDSVDLNGWDTRLGCPTWTVEIDDLDFGNGGKLVVNNGQLVVDTLTTADGPARLEVERIGNCEVAGAAAPTNKLTCLVSTDGKTGSAGRLSVTGSLAGDCDMTIDAHGQFFGYDGGDITINGTLTLNGALHRTGFDGLAGGASSFTMSAGSTLVVSGNSTSTPVIREIWSGMNGLAADNPTDVASTFVCGGTLDLTNAASGSYDLITADTVSGTFATVIGGTVNSIGSGAVNVTVG